MYNRILIVVACIGVGVGFVIGHYSSRPTSEIISAPIKAEAKGEAAAPPLEAFLDRMVEAYESGDKTLAHSYLHILRGYMRALENSMKKST